MAWEGDRPAAHNWEKMWVIFPVHTILDHLMICSFILSLRDFTNDMERHWLYPEGPSLDKFQKKLSVLIPDGI